MALRLNNHQWGFAALPLCHTRDVPHQLAELGFALFAPIPIRSDFVLVFDLDHEIAVR